jgi:hypothetical protein
MLLYLLQLISSCIHNSAQCLLKFISVCMHGTPQEPPNDFSWTFDNCELYQYLPDLFTHSNFHIYIDTGKIFSLLTSSMALHFTAPSASLAMRRIWILPMNQHAWRPITFGMKGSSYQYSQITGGVENAVSLHVDITRTSGRGSVLPSEAAV